MMAENGVPPKEALHKQEKVIQSYTENLANSLNKFRKEQIYCDVVIVVNGTKFHAHKNILAASSPYFSKLFNQTKKKRKEKDTTVLVNDMPAVIMEHLLDYLYTGQVIFTANNVEELIKASNVLVLHQLKIAGCKHLEGSLKLDNCLYLYAFGDSNDCSSLKQAAQKFISRNFRDACKTNGFVKLRLKQVEELISDDDLVIGREEEVYEAVLAWVKHDQTRAGSFPTLFRHVRLSSVSKYYLHTNIASEELVKANRSCVEILLETMRHLSLTAQAESASATPPHTPRKCLQTHVGAIISYGGLYTLGETSYSSCVCYVPSERAWYSLTPESEGLGAGGGRLKRWAHVMVALEGFLYAAGGFCDDTRQEATSSAARYDPRTDTWVAVAPLPRSTALPTAVAHGGSVYVIGGSDSHALREVQRYTPTSDTWEVLTPLTTGRCAPCATTDQRYIYVFGGMQENGEFLRTAEKYDTSTNNWEPINPMSTERAFACAVAMGDAIYVIGGSTDVLGNQALASAEVYNTRTEDWKVVSNMSIARFAACACALGDRVYVLGGGQGIQSHASIEWYSQAHDMWEVAGDLPRATAHATCCAVTMRRDHFKSLPNISDC